MSAHSPRGSTEDEWLQDALACFAVTHDPLLRDEIAGRTSWLAVRCARRFWDRGEPFDDLTQVAQVGLLHAIDRFDPSIELPFGAFATPTIIGELRRHFRDHTWSVHVPRRAKELRTAVNAARDELASTLMRAPSVDEIAARMHMPATHVIEALDSNSAYRTQRFDPTRSRASTSSDADLEAVLDHEVVEAPLNHLQPRARPIIEMRFLEGMSQERIAAEIGSSQVHAGRLIQIALVELRSVEGRGERAV